MRKETHLRYATGINYTGLTLADHVAGDGRVLDRVLLDTVSCTHCFKMGVKKSPNDDNEYR